MNRRKNDVVSCLRRYRKYWLIPLVVALVTFVVIVFLLEVVPIMSPFVYTLF